ncbi:hypothetical protein JOF56_010020 [Kibdelosporangium banguiense]|uniref:Uncharacterized protein n=1 Tax=Kibdelosporangium banguiense TaxID=1365924 RepID=A0ABS4TZ03_9PSEU|nr:hypothetical protein [Kibdelosporangium banguiense]
MSVPQPLGVIKCRHVDHRVVPHIRDGSGCSKIHVVKIPPRRPPWSPCPAARLLGERAVNRLRRLIIGVVCPVVSFWAGRSTEVCQVPQLRQQIGTSCVGVDVGLSSRSQSSLAKMVVVYATTYESDPDGRHCYGQLQLWVRYRPGEAEDQQPADTVDCHAHIFGHDSVTSWFFRVFELSHLLSLRRNSFTATRAISSAKTTRQVPVVMRPTSIAMRSAMVFMSRLHLNDGAAETFQAHVTDASTAVQYCMVPVFLE